MKQTMIVLAVLSISLAAYAGKQERDLMTKEVAPAVETAVNTLKSHCGCDVKISVDESNLKTMDELRQAERTAKSVSEGAEKYCTDAPSKKAICQLRTLVLTKGKSTAFTFKDGAGTATTDGHSYCSWGQMTRELDK
jgi:hypothetical protein